MKFRKQFHSYILMTGLTKKNYVIKISHLLLINSRTVEVQSMEEKNV